MAIQTRLEDMVIGDKIRCAAAGSTPTFYSLGTSNAKFIPAASLATPNTTDGIDFYFIYVGNDFRGRMILVADRNVKHSESWDSLNTKGFATKDGVEVKIADRLTGDISYIANWKTNIRLLTGGTSSTTTANSEWDKYIVNGPVGSDNATWNWQYIMSWTSSVPTSSASSRVGRANSSASDWGYNPSNTAAASVGFRPVLVAESLAQPITNKYLVQDASEVKAYDGSSWVTAGTAPATKAMFDSHGMDSLSLLNKDTVSLLSSGQPELLCWTDQADPTRHVTMNVGEHWAPVSDTLPAVDTFLSEGMDDLRVVPESGWNALQEDFEIVTYTNLMEGSQSVHVNATPFGQLVYAETDFSNVSDLKITAVQDDVNALRLLASGDLGATWKAFNGSWQAVDPANVKADGMTVDAFNALTNEEWDDLGGQIRLAYYLENEAIVDAVEVTKDAVATETPTLDSIKFTYDDLTLEGRLKDLEMINAINMGKLQFKANSLMNSTKYQLHDLVVDTFEDDSMITSEGGTPVTQTAAQTTPAAMGNGFISRASIKTNKKILGLEVR